MAPAFIYQPPLLLSISSHPPSAARGSPTSPKWLIKHHKFLTASTQTPNMYVQPGPGLNTPLLTLPRSPLQCLFLFLFPTQAPLFLYSVLPSPVLEVAEREHPDSALLSPHLQMPRLLATRAHQLLLLQGRRYPHCI